MAFESIKILWRILARYDSFLMYIYIADKHTNNLHSYGVIIPWKSVISF